MKATKTKRQSWRRTCYVITLELPDGKNYWSGLQHFNLASGPVDLDFWSVYRNQVFTNGGVGIFTSWGECEMYKRKFIQDQNAKIEILDTSKKAYWKYEFIHFVVILLWRLGIRNKLFGINIFPNKPKNKFVTSIKKFILRCNHLFTFKTKTK